MIIFKKIWLRLIQPRQFSNRLKDFDIFFDKATGRDFAGFPENSEHFVLYDNMLDKIERLSESEVRIYFCFGSHACRMQDMGDGETASLLILVKYYGSILCSGIKRFDKKSFVADDEFFIIEKPWFGKTKIIRLNDSEIGNIEIECDKLYAEEMGKYRKDKSNQWVSWW